MNQEAQQSARWKAVVNELRDGNQQNANAANAGDGPKHVAWLTFISMLGDRLKTLVETHSGGGIYEVPRDRFCVKLPAESILGKHQRDWKLPVAGVGNVYYSASGDQALCHLPPGSRYVAFDKCGKTAERLRAVAEWRGRGDCLDSRGGYAGNGSRETSLACVLSAAQCPLLIMVDPFAANDLERAAGEVCQIADARSILFGASHGEDSRWHRIIDDFCERDRIVWKWRGDASPRERSGYLFLLLISGPQEREIDQLCGRLQREHDLLWKCRGPDYGYTSDGPERLPRKRSRPQFAAGRDRPRPPQAARPLWRPPHHRTPFDRCL